MCNDIALYLISTNDSRSRQEKQGVTPMKKWHLRLVHYRFRAPCKWVRALILASVFLSGGYSLAAENEGSSAKSAGKNTLQLSMPLLNYVRAEGDMGGYDSSRDSMLTLYTPGVNLAYTRRVMRHMDIGAGLAYSVLSDSIYALHDIRPTVQVSAVFQHSKGQGSLSIGLDTGALLVPYRKKWKRDEKDAAFGYGFTAGIFLRHNWFISDWGLTVGAASRFARAYQRKRDSFDIISSIMVDAGAVYRF